jgi:hypothetical protein
VCWGVRVMVIFASSGRCTYANTFDGVDFDISLLRHHDNNFSGYFDYGVLWRESCCWWSCHGLWLLQIHPWGVDGGLSLTVFISVRLRQKMLLRPASATASLSSPINVLRPGYSVLLVPPSRGLDTGVAGRPPLTMFISAHLRQTLSLSSA